MFYFDFERLGLMLKHVLCGLAAGFLLSVSNAQATPVIQTFTLSGTGIIGGYDGGHQFGAGYSFPNSLAYSVTLAFDASALTGDTCNTASSNSCNWNFGAGGISETVTINGITHTYTAASGGIQYCVNCGGNFVNIFTTGPGAQFSGNFTDATKQLFSSTTDANDIFLPNDVTNIAITGTFQSNIGPGGLTSFVIAPTRLTADPADAASAVPEPMTLSLFGATLFGAVAMQRRKTKNRYLKPL